MDSLVGLVKSLKKSEKRYFSLQSSLQDGDKKYLQLFQLIDDLEHPTDAEMENIFENKSSYYHHKKYLYQQLISSLRNYHSKDVNSKNHAFLEELEILKNKLLYNALGKRLKVAKKFAVQYEQFNLLIELCQYEHFYLVYGKSVNDIDTILEIQNQSQVYLSQKQNLLTIQVLEVQLKSLLRKWRFARTKEEKKTIQKIAQNKLIKTDQFILSKRAYVSHLECKITIAKLMGKLDVFKQQVELLYPFLEQHSFLITLNLQVYLATITNFIVWHIQKKELDPLPNLFKKMETYYGQSIKTDIFIFLKITPNQISYFDRKKDTKAIFKLLKSVEKKINQLKPFMDDQGILVTYTNLAMYSHKYGRMEKSLEFIDLALKKCTKNRRTDLFNLLSLFKILTLYDLKRFDEIEDATDSIYRKLYRYKMNFKPELLVIHFFKTTPFSIMSKNEIIKSLTLFRQKVKKMTDETPVEQIGFFYHFNMDRWISEKLEELD